MVNKLAVKYFEATRGGVSKDYANNILEIFASSAYSRLNKICEDFRGVGLGEHHHDRKGSCIRRGNFFVSNGEGERDRH